MNHSHFFFDLILYLDNDHFQWLSQKYSFTHFFKQRRIEILIDSIYM